MAVTIVCSQTTNFSRTGTATLWVESSLGSAVVSALTLSQSGIAKTDAYSFSWPSPVVGLYEIWLIATGQTNPFWEGVVNITATTGTFYARDFSVGSANNYITITPAQAAAALVAGQIAIVRGDTLTQTLTVGSLVGRSKLWLTMKLASLTGTTTNTDASSTIQIIEGTGLVVLNGSSSGLTAANASLVVTDETTGTIDLTISGSTTAVLDLQDLLYDVQSLVGIVLTTQASGTVSISADITQAVS